MINKQHSKTQAEFHARRQQEQGTSYLEAHGEKAFRREVVTRLRRVETRLVAGLESLGASVVNHAENIVVTPVEGGRGLITITSLGTTVKDILDVLKGAEGTFDIVYKGKIKYQITTQTSNS